jgi:Tol biopolymer transport system component
MAVEPGTRMGQFEVLSALGRGGMGEVYRARDSRLSREVAIKILPETLAHDPDRVARFEREARVLASLNHPHIAAVHGFEQGDSQRFLVLELVPGPTLADRLAKGPLDVKEALQIARQIAEALEEAHAKGVIHRDLKPANVKITPEGRVKVLDFGLAKALHDELPDSSQEDSPTMTRAADSAGIILGTAGYMSPEQARGQAVDKRTDVWAFGCVLYEMLTGRRLFSGPSATDSVAAVLTLEPDWSRLPEKTPPLVRSLLRRCLQKDKASRLHDIADARLEIEEALRDEVSGVLPAPRPQLVLNPRRLLGHALTFLVGALVGGAVVHLAARPASTVGLSARFNINLPADSVLRNNLQGALPIALSTDGTRIAYVGARPDGRNQVFIRRMDRITPEAVPGTEGGLLPFFSPDGEWLAFVSEGKLKKVPVAGGQAVVICDAPDARGGSWSEDGTILLSPNNAGGLVRVRASGGPPEPAGQPDPSRQEDGHRWPHVLPGGKAALISVQPLSGREAQRRIDVMTLATGERKTLVQHGSYPVYAGGYLFFGRSGQILAAPFDPDRLELRGEPQAVLDDVRMDPKNTGLVYFDIAPSGAAVYVPGFARPRERDLVFMDRQGRSTPVTSARRAYFSPGLSPDGRQVAVVVEGLEDVLWVLDIPSGTLNRLTFDMDVNIPVWSGDGRSIFFTGNADGPRSAYRIAADGSGKPELVYSKTEWWINDLSPRADGSGVMVAAQDVRSHDLYFVPAGTREVQPFLATPSEERRPAFSPNGAYVAYTSSESGRAEIYVRPFPGPGPKRQVSTKGGFGSQWSRDGREIYYWEAEQVGRFMKAAFDPAPGGTISKPERLFEVPVRMIDTVGLMPDGQRFLMVKPQTEEEEPLLIVVIPNFLAELKARLSGLRPATL